MALGRAYLPHDAKAEESLLGYILHDNHALLDAIEVIKPECFYSELNQLIFRSMMEMDAENLPIDEITLHDRLHTSALYKNQGAAVYLTDLLNYTPKTADIRYYADIIFRKFQLRELILAAQDIAEGASRGDGQKMEELVEKAESSMLSIASYSRKQDIFSVREVLGHTLEWLEEVEQDKEGRAGTPTGFMDLDELMSGMKAGELVIVAARPSMGKTSFTLNIASYVAQNSQKTVLVFSLEMTKEQLVLRLLCSQARVDSQKVYEAHNQLSSEEWDNLTTAAEQMANMPLFLTDTLCTPFDIHRIVRRFQTEGQLGLVVVDYLQLVRAGGGRESREAEVAEISRRMKEIAKEFNVPVIVCSQLNRALESRPDKRPRLADLRESGAIEQDADVVMFIYRDEVYDKETEDKGIAEVHVAKNRTGRITTGRHGVKLAFLPTYTMFANLARREEPF